MRALAILAKLSFAALLISAGVGAVAAFGTRFGIWDYRIGLLMLYPWFLCFGAAAFALGLIWAAWAMLGNRSDGALFGSLGLVGSIILTGAPLYHLYVGSTLPAIHDISTDTEHAPEFVALKSQRAGALTPPEYDGPALAKGPDGKIAASWKLQKKYYEEIRPRAELTAPENLFRRATKAVYAMGWRVVAVVPDEGRIEATDSNFWFGFTDDIVIRVKPAGQGAKLDIRSKSRLDLPDNGKNAARIDAYMKTLSATF